MGRAGRRNGFTGGTAGRTAWAALILGAALLGACDGEAHLGGRGDDDGPGSSGHHGTSSTWVELAPGTLSLAGGAATTPGGQGQPGGRLHVISRGGITFDARAALPSAPQIPAAPADALRPTSLGADVDANGPVVLHGTLDATGSGTRTIRASGDLFVDGVVRAAPGQALRLSASGTVYVEAAGLVDTSGQGPDLRGGDLGIDARRIVIVGRVATLGGAGADAGNVTLRASQEIDVTGDLDEQGGDRSAASDTKGGAGGNLRLQAGGDVALVGTVRLRGGAAISSAGAATGGHAGAVVIDCDSAVTIGNVLDARGGLARSSASGVAVVGGAAGALKVGETAAPTDVRLLADTDVDGGEGEASGGAGGAMLLLPHGADLRFAARVAASGGASAQQPGKGGLVEGHPGPDGAATDAGVVIDGSVVASGGDASTGAGAPAGAATPGGAGGLVKLVVLSTNGKMTLGGHGVVQVDGGASAGTGTAGAGGTMYLFTRDGDASIAGQLLARGGDAGDTGKGGLGGFVYVFTDDNHGGADLAGVLRIQSSGLVDASGGAGAVGGSARSDGVDDAVADWPVTQDNEYDVRNIAVLINSDGVHGGATGWVENHGMIRARGGRTNGSGGDVFFHGKAEDGNPIPVPGRIDDAGDGSGRPGTFAGKHIVIVGPIG